MKTRILVGVSGLDSSSIAPRPASGGCLYAAQAATVRPATGSDVEDIVSVHLQSFPGFFLTFLGRRFLEELYQAILKDATGVLLVAEDGDSILGFVAGVTSQGNFYRRLINHRMWAFAYAAVGSVVRQPRIVPRLLRALRRPSEAGESAADACLMSIGVAPRAKGCGVGKQLVSAFCGACLRRGVLSVCLTTDRDGNEVVNRFYVSLGFRVARTFVTPEGRRMYEYVIDLPQTMDRHLQSQLTPVPW